MGGGGGITQALTVPPRRGVRFLRDHRLSDCSSSPPVPGAGNPLHGYLVLWKRLDESRLGTGLPVCASPLINDEIRPRLNLMDATYAVITMPTSCQLWRDEGFVPQ